LRRRASRLIYPVKSTAKEKDRNLAPPIFNAANLSPNPGEIGMERWKTADRIRARASMEHAKSSAGGGGSSAEAGGRALAWGSGVGRGESGAGSGRGRGQACCRVRREIDIEGNGGGRGTAVLVNGEGNGGVGNAGADQQLAPGGASPRIGEAASGNGSRAGERWEERSGARMRIASWWKKTASGTTGCVVVSGWGTRKETAREKNQCGLGKIGAGVSGWFG